MNALLLQGYDSAKGFFNKGTVLFVLKDLWLSEILVPASFGKSLLNGPIGNLSFCYCSADCYLVNDNKIRFLGAIDTIVSVKKWIVVVADDLIKKIITNVMVTADSLISQPPSLAKETTYEALSNELKSACNFPILNSPLRKGIYLSYNSFLTNNPVTDEFKITEDAKREYIQCPSLNDSITNQAWGYSDGAEAYIHLNEKYYRLIRSQNTFDFVGPRKITNLHSGAGMILNASIATFLRGAVGGAVTLLFMGSDNKIMKELVPYQLNITKGTIY
jgi:hypothetical protein